MNMNALTPPPRGTGGDCWPELTGERELRRKQFGYHLDKQVD
ncbi:MAG: hypothetical protein OXD45_09445 [Rhodobacteraceae bacterium]|nr:hypothetical protein [Paracoccaceae bacterium]